MNLEPIKNEKQESPDINKGEVLLPEIYEELKYNFQKGDRVKPTDKALKDNKELKLDNNYAIQSCKLSNLGDIQVWIVYIAGRNVRNPYYANYFKPKDED
jgi:hypothetical protein